MIKQGAGVEVGRLAAARIWTGDDEDSGQDGGAVGVVDERRESRKRQGFSLSCHFLRQEKLPGETLCWFGFFAGCGYQELSFQYLSPEKSIGIQGEISSSRDSISALSSMSTEVQKNLHVI